MPDSELSVSHPAFAGLIGAAREDITPPVGIYARNWGAATHETAKGIHRPLTATALTLQAGSDDSPLVLVSMDLGWWRRKQDEWELRSAVLEALSLDPARLMISFTHTHAGPCICREDADKPGGHLVPAYLEGLREAVIRAAQRALENREPAVLEWSRGRCDLARNRDLPDPAGDRYICGYYPPGPADDTLLVGRVTTEAGRPLATLVNYACHPTTLAWENRLISPDYVGAMREVVEAATGNAPCLFLQGASGELAPREQYTANTDLPDAHGRQLGYAVLSVLEGMLPSQRQLVYARAVESGAPLAVWERASSQASSTLKAVLTDVEVPLKPWPTVAEIDAQLQNCQDRAFAERLARQRRVRESVGDGETARIPVWCWRVGEAFFVGQGNEAYSRLQTELRAEFRETPVVVMNVVNGHIGYLPPAELYEEDIYPVWQTPYAPDSLERTIACCERTLEQLL
jgi:hypothetical protein